MSALFALFASDGLRLDALGFDAPALEQQRVTHWPERLGWTALTLLAVVAVALLMRRGWRRRAQRHADLPPLPAVPPAHEPAVTLGPVEATYVSTTTSGDWLDRVVALGLGARSESLVAVSRAGVAVDRRGAETPLFLPAPAIRSVGWTSGMAGKFVGGEGILVVTWAHGDRLLDTGLHVRHATESTALHDAVAALLPSKARETR